MNLLIVSQLSLVQGKAKTAHGSGPGQTQGKENIMVLDWATSFEPQTFFIQDLASSKQNHRVLKGDKIIAYLFAGERWLQSEQLNLIWGERCSHLQTEAEMQKAKMKMLVLSSDNWLWPSNTTYKFHRANFSPSGILYSMIDCISYAITLNHRICVQNQRAEPSCLLKWQSSLDISLSSEALGYHKERHHHLSCLKSLEAEGNV